MSVCTCKCVCETQLHLCSVSSGFIPLIFPLSQLPYLCLTLHLAFFFITPFDDEKLIAVPGHETHRGRETESEENRKREWGEVGGEEREMEGGLRDGWME